MKSKWILVLGLIGLFVVFCGAIYAKKIAMGKGQHEIDKTLNSISIYKKMQTESALDFEFLLLDTSLNSLAPDYHVDGAVKSEKHLDSYKKLSDIKGKVILLNFWASWCAPCIQEFPDMIRLIEQRPEIKIVAVNRDVEKENALKFIDSFPEAKGKILFYWDPKGQITSMYGTEVLPESFIIGKNFKVLKKIVGVEDWDSPVVLKFIDSL